jgi:23S rRNA (cytosine1962-C5)-methyltransferase
MAKIILKDGREHSVLRRHPWIFSGAIARIEGGPQDGSTVDVIDSAKRWLGRGSYSAKSQISVRLLTFDEAENIDADFWRLKISNAIALRKGLKDLQGSTACRLMNAESDGMPGVIVDRYADFLVCQFSSAGAEFWRETIVSQLVELWPCEGIFERSDSDSRVKEGYPARVITLQGSPLLSLNPLNFIHFNHS